MGGRTWPLRIPDLGVVLWLGSVQLWEQDQSMQLKKLWSKRCVQLRRQPPISCFDQEWKGLSVHCNLSGHVSHSKKGSGCSGRTYCHWQSLCVRPFFCWGPEGRWSFKERRVSDSGVFVVGWKRIKRSVNPLRLNCVSNTPTVQSLFFSIPPVGAHQPRTRVNLLAAAALENSDDRIEK